MPEGNFMVQLARNLTAHTDGSLRDNKYLIFDNDTPFKKKFCCILEDAGEKIARTAIQAPVMNAIAETYVGSVKRECLSKLILFGDRLPQRVPANHTAHYRKQQPHQRLDDYLIQPRPGAPNRR